MTTATHLINGTEYRPTRLSNTSFETWGISHRAPGRRWSEPDAPFFSSHTDAYNFLATWQRHDLDPKMSSALNYF